MVILFRNLEFRRKSRRLKPEGCFEAGGEALEGAWEEVIVVEGEHRAVVVRGAVNLQLPAGLTVVQEGTFQLEKNIIIKYDSF